MQQNPTQTTDNFFTTARQRTQDAVIHDQDYDTKSVATAVTKSIIPDHYS